jgi:hypothetical protein
MGIGVDMVKLRGAVGGVATAGVDMCRCICEVERRGDVEVGSLAYETP